MEDPVISFKPLENSKNLEVVAYIATASSEKSSQIYYRVHRIDSDAVYLVPSVP